MKNTIARQALVDFIKDDIEEQFSILSDSRFRNRIRESEKFIFLSYAISDVNFDIEHLTGGQLDLLGEVVDVERRIH